MYSKSFYFLLSGLLSASTSVEDVDIEFLSLGFELAAKKATDGVSEDSAVGVLLDGKSFEFLHVVDKNWDETVWKHELGFVVRTETNSWVGWGTAFLAAEAGIDTTGTAP